MSFHFGNSELPHIISDKFSNKFGCSISLCCFTQDLLCWKTRIARKIGASSDARKVCIDFFNGLIFGEDLTVTMLIIYMVLTRSDPSLLHEYSSCSLEERSGDKTVFGNYFLRARDLGELSFELIE